LAAVAKKLNASKPADKRRTLREMAEDLKQSFSGRWKTKIEKEHPEWSDKQVAAELAKHEKEINQAVLKLYLPPVSRPSGN